MATLTLQYLDGTSETRELSKSQPLTIGKQAFNDIAVTGDDVAPLHCRISWNKHSFEVTAATSHGVEVNSTQVMLTNLKSGDVIRVGNVDFLFQDGSSSGKPAKSAKAIDEDSSRTRKPKSPEKKAPEPDPNELSLFEGEVVTASQAMLNAVFQDETADASGSDFETAKKPAARPERVNAVRPGEQDVFKSPLVLGLAGGALTLLLITGIFWFFIAREQSNRLYDRAVREMNDGQYAQSIATFAEFAQKYPSHKLRRQAEWGLGKASILKEISGATPAWKRGLEGLHELIKSHRKESDFVDLHPAIVQYAEQIALGSAKTAETTREPDFLPISSEAQTLVERYSDATAPPTATLGRINEQRVKAERAIEKQRIFDRAMNVVDEAITQKQPMVALSERERLVHAFPDFVNTKRVKDALQQAVALELSAVATDETEKAAETNDETAFMPTPLYAVSQARSQTSETGSGKVVFVQAKDQCYAIDSVSGDLIWRRTVGTNQPFFPLPVSGDQPAVLLFDTRQNAVLKCLQADGKLLWRQPLGSRVIGRPLIHQGQLYVSVDGKSLARVDVESGRLSAKVHFSQNLASPPVLSHDENFLIVPGAQAMIYALSLRSAGNKPALSAVATTFTDHTAGSISAPPLAMGQLLLICENDRADSARLRLWNASRPSESLVELASSRVGGQVHDVPVLRGNQLVVPSEGEQFAAFMVNDDQGREGITLVGQYRAQASSSKQDAESPIFVSIGADGQFWAAGTAFRRFEIASNGIKMDPNSTAPGIASQPLQQFGDYFFVGRQTRASRAVTFSAIEREKLVNPWRIVVADAPLELMMTNDGGAVWVGESGNLYSAGSKRLEQGGIGAKLGTELELPAGLKFPIRASQLQDQRLVVFAGGEKVLMFLFNSAGQLTSRMELADFPETDPVLIDEGLVVPLHGRLKLISLSTTKTPVQEWTAPVGEASDRRWTHLVHVNGRELIACDQTGEMIRVQFRQGDVPHLAEVSRLQLEQPVDVHPMVRGESLFLADAAGNCRQLNISSFDTDAQTKLMGPIRNWWSVEQQLIVHAGDAKLHCLMDGKSLPEKWNFDLKQLLPVGQIVRRGTALWVGCLDGTIVILNAETGQLTRQITLPQSLSLGLRQLGDALWAVASDGTLYRVD